MQTSLKDKVAIITGAGRGIGAATAHRLAALGARIAVVSRTAENAERSAHSLNNEFGSGMARAYAVDVADNTAVKEASQNIVADFGQVDILVNNAGVTRDNLSMRMSEQDWDLVLNTNLKGAFNWVQAVQRPMMKQGAGRIINISSVIGLIGNPGQINYAASKAGLIGMSKTLARELSSRSITVNCIAPGFITTDMTSDLTAEQKETIRLKVPLGIFGKPEDVAYAVEFLARPEAYYITGQTIAVDGGMVM